LGWGRTATPPQAISLLRHGAAARAVIVAGAQSGSASAPDYDTLFVQVPGNPRYLTFLPYSLLAPKPAEPSPPLPGLVPPSLPKTKPGEGGFTAPPHGKPVPGFTPAPPSAPVRPGHAPVENKPIVLDAARPVDPNNLGKTTTTKSSQGTLSGALEQLDGTERAMADELAALGHNVEAVPRSGTKTPDFIVDGQETELKTLKGAGPNTLKNAIHRI
jgi:hypothetical protein